ncbi:MAG: hypothetical protein NBV68_17165 [Erythrobacter sp.]|uniref:hypothetical protein n=1 Tax=Erythrobacter sp. TaxID=1042 RepID=UPI0025F5BC64|nr:hypothetical protein [Erythrobacter sp.]MCM0001106.1 hypothetical protein [Erythrobacter sp.]
MTLDRVRDLVDFYPGDRIWWLYVREAVQHWLEKHEDPAIRVAHDGVKAFPENLPDERTRWLTLRDQVQALLDREG